MGPEAVSLMIAGAGAWEKPETWSIYNYVIFAIVITVGWEIMQLIVMKLPEFFNAKQIPMRGKHLDVLEWIDVACIAFNRLLSFLFVFNVLQFIFGAGAETGHIIWAMDEASFLNVGGSLVAMFLFYDFFYCLFHMALHHRSVYALVHKHHHRQKAPSRGNADAINVHPFEFAVGEYLHLVTVAVVPGHVIAVFLFIAIGGLAASLNHCRHEVKLPLKIFNTKFHDQHHVVPNTNYSQYISFWDMVWGSFRDHPDDVQPLKIE